MTDENELETRESDRDSDDAPLPVLLRIGMAAALLGIAIGGIFGFKHLDGFGDLFRTLAYGHWMLPAIGLGGVAVGIAVVEIVRTGKYWRPLGVFALGGAAIAIPFLIGVGLLLLVLSIAVAVFSEL